MGPHAFSNTVFPPRTFRVRSPRLGHRLHSPAFTMARPRFSLLDLHQDLSPLLLGACDGGSLATLRALCKPARAAVEQHVAGAATAGQRFTTLPLDALALPRSFPRLLRLLSGRVGLDAGTVAGLRGAVQHSVVVPVQTAHTRAQRAAAGDEQEFYANPSPSQVGLGTPRAAWPHAQELEVHGVR